MKPDYTLALEERMRPVDIRDDAPAMRTDGETLLHHRRAAAADRIGEDLIRNMA